MRTSAGLILHTGDFKMDQLPLDRRITDLRGFALLGEEGVDLFLTDSTNAEVPGFTMHELDIYPAIERVFDRAERRIIVACFASHVHRVQQVLRRGRGVRTQGRHRRPVDGAEHEHRRGARLPAGARRARSSTSASWAIYPEDEQVLVCTGSQGEPMAALSRMANRDHQIEVGPGDTVMLASSLIPGNENAVYRVINGLMRLGAHVVHRGNASVHVSGHASAGELLYCYNIVRPTNVIPVHGEWRHLVANGALAEATGVPKRRVVMAENGVVVDLVDGIARISGAVDCGYVYVDGSSVGGADEALLKDRRILRDEGFVTAIVTVDSSRGKVAPGPGDRLPRRRRRRRDLQARRARADPGGRGLHGQGGRGPLPVAAGRPPHDRLLRRRQAPAAADDHSGGHRGVRTCRGVHSRSSRRAARSAARRPSTYRAAAARWLTADALMSRRAAHSRPVRP